MIEVIIDSLDETYNKETIIGLISFYSLYDKTQSKDCVNNYLENGQKVLLFFDCIESASVFIDSSKPIGVNCSLT